MNQIVVRDENAFQVRASSFSSDAEIKRHLENNGFPNLVGASYKITSPETSLYNCIAFAAGDEQNWWQPIPPKYRNRIKGLFWPTNDPDMTVENYVNAFRQLSYEVCDDGVFEQGYEKVVLYVENNQPTHMAKQLNDHLWVSKLGMLWDIEHDTEHCLSIGVYGHIHLYMKRRLKTADS